MESPLHRLIGEWEFESSIDGRFMGRGRTTFRWIEDGAFVLQHADAQPSDESPPEWVANSPMPVTAVIGFDDTTGDQAMLYADARGVYRIYRMTVTDEAWTVWREAPGFFQRFIGTFADDGNTITGRWEASPDGAEWETDFDMVYRAL